MSFHVRRKDKEITDERTLKAIFKTGKYMTIALSMDNKPYLVSLNYGYDEENYCLYFHCAKEGRKMQYLASNDEVWGEILLDYGYREGECAYSYASIHFSGKVSLIDDLESKRKAVECMIRHVDRNPETLLSTLDTHRLQNTTVGKIDLRFVSGKKSKDVRIEPAISIDFHQTN